MAFFHWFCRPEFCEEIEGDLLEQFDGFVHKYGYVKANRLFVKEVILLFRPAIVGSIYQLTNTETMIITKQNKRLATILASASALLLIPLIAMNFTNEVNWKLIDFLVAAILLMGTGMALEFVLRKVKTRARRVVYAVILILALLLAWTELAVGILS